MLLIILFSGCCSQSCAVCIGTAQRLEILWHVLPGIPDSWNNVLTLQFGLWFIEELPHFNKIHTCVYSTYFIEMPGQLSAAPTKAHKKITNVQYKHSTETDYLKEKEPM